MFKTFDRGWIAGSLRMVFCALIISGGSVGAQIKTDATAAELKQIKDDADARKAAYQSLLDVETTKKAYEAVIDPAKTASDAEAAAIKASKELAESKTAEANAQKAQSEAELAALKKKYGDFAASGVTGTAELVGTAGNAESTLLGMLAVEQIAGQFAATLNGLKSNPAKFVLATPTTVPDFQALTAFEAQMTSFQTAVAAAKASTSDDAKKNAGVKTESIAAFGAGVEAFSKLLSFAKTDYKFVGFDVTSTDAMLLRAVAGKLNKPTEIPAVYIADATTAANEVLAKISDLDRASIEAKGRTKFYEAAIAEFEKQLIAKPTDADLRTGVDTARKALVTWKAISDSLDAWGKQFSTVDDKGSSPAATILRQNAIKRKLTAGAVLVIVELHKVAGTGYTKKNLWSSLGANPFFVMGGAVASYVALSGTDGSVLASQLLPLHGGYQSVSDIEAVINKKPKP
jgi:hypothetical protein